MIKRIFSAVFADFHWKLLALVAAVVVWIVGMNMSDPSQNESVLPRLQLQNLEVMTRDGIIILNEDALLATDVSVILRAYRSEMDDLRHIMATDPERFANMIEVSVDFRAVDSSAVRQADGVLVQRLSISPNLHPGFEHLSLNPAYIDVYLDTVAAQPFEVDLIRQGVVSPGFELQHERIIGGGNVSVRGSRTELRTVHSVRAFVDISGVHGDVEQIVALQVIDIYGEDITERFHLNFTEATVGISIWQTQRMDIDVRGTGSPAAGFAVAGISWDIDSIGVVSADEDIEPLESIPVNLSGAAGNITQTINIKDYLPEGVYLMQDEPYEMTVSVIIEPIEERLFTVPRDNVTRRGVVGLYQLLGDNAPVRVIVSGPRSVIANLDVSQIGLEFDLRGLPIGVHTVSLAVQLPPGLAHVGSAPTMLVQIHEPVAAENNEDDYDVIILPIDEEETYEYEEEPQGSYDDELYVGTDDE